MAEAGTPAKKSRNSEEISSTATQVWNMRNISPKYDLANNHHQCSFRKKRKITRSVNQWQRLAPQRRNRGIARKYRQQQHRYGT